MATARDQNILDNESANQVKKVSIDKQISKAAVCKNLLMHSCQRQIPWLDFVDSAENEDGYLRSEFARIGYWEICSTSLSIGVRTIAVYINVKLAIDYYCQGHSNYFFWTVTCMLLPVCATSLIHANM